MLLLGDFNAKTKDHADFIEFDENLFDLVGVETDCLPDETSSQKRRGWGGRGGNCPP